MAFNYCKLFIFCYYFFSFSATEPWPEDAKLYQPFEGNLFIFHFLDKEEMTFWKNYCLIFSIGIYVITTTSVNCHKSVIISVRKRYY